MTKCDVSVIGAGPYGLSAAAHLMAVNGLNVRVSGEPMSFWERHMPAGMRLKSVWRASHISDPSGGLTLDAYQSARGCQLSILVREHPKQLFDKLETAGVKCDFREPNVIRVAPTPLYNTFHEVWRFAQTLATHQ